MSWHDGPLQSWYDIHEALRNELAEIRHQADAASVADEDAIRSLTDSVQFFMDVLTVHSEHEDGIIFPFMRWRGLEVSDSYRDDHHREAARVYDIRVRLIALRFREAGQDTAGELAQLRDQLAELSADLDTHLAAEERDLIPRCEALPVSDQLDLVTRMVSQTPEWIAPHLTPWMVRMVSLDHQVHLLDAWSKALAPDAFATKTDAIRAAMSDSDWAALSARVPALSAT
jgi:iron-sulfur cluster repair protein YtfE (RIC family)